LINTTARLERAFYGLEKCMTKYYLWFLFIDLPLSILKVIIALVGIFIVPIALPFAREEHLKHSLIKKQLYYAWEYKRLPKIFAWWDNADYGVQGNDVFRREAYNPFHERVGGFLSNWYWLAIRNPANGLYKTRLFSVVPKELDYMAWLGSQLVDNNKPGWQFVFGRKGRRLYTGLYYYKGSGEYRFGFKLLPTERTREREIGLTFIANPFKRHKK